MKTINGPQDCWALAQQQCSGQGPYDWLTSHLPWIHYFFVLSKSHLTKQNFYQINLIAFTSAQWMEPHHHWSWTEYFKLDKGKRWDNYPFFTWGNFFPSRFSQTISSATQVKTLLKRLLGKKWQPRSLLDILPNRVSYSREGFRKTQGLSSLPLLDTRL